MNKNFDFDEIVQRRGTGCCKWDEMPADDIIPMWVADMDFRTAPCIVECLKNRVEHGVFGYTEVPQSYYDALCRWFSTRHGWSIDPRSVIVTSGVVPALSAVIKALARRGDRVLVQTPVYNCFFSSIRNNGCTAVELPLIYTPEGYRMDFEALERAAAEPHTSLLLLCNPHNPAGRVWRRDELLRLGEICLRHGVTVVADEIHCELTFEGHDYIPFASLGGDIARRAVVCCSPSKAFNTAGLQIANIVAADDEVRRRIDRAINDNEVCDVNPFGVAALTTAYNDGGPWLDALRKYLWQNYVTLRDFFARRLPQLHVTPLEGTYLVWVECRSTGLDSDTLVKKLLEEGRVALNSGTMYGAAGEGFVRINIACPRTVMLEGLERVARVIESLPLLS